VSVLRYPRCTKGSAVAAKEKLTDPVSNRSLAGEAISSTMLVEDFGVFGNL